VNGNTRDASGTDAQPKDKGAIGPHRLSQAGKIHGKQHTDFAGCCRYAGSKWREPAVQPRRVWAEVVRGTGERYDGRPVERGAGAGDGAYQSVQLEVEQPERSSVLHQRIGLVDVDWLEIFQWVDINNTSIPKPISLPNQTYCVRSLPQVSMGQGSYGWPGQLAWDYNKNLSYGIWPGAGVIYYPLVRTGNVAKQNGPMAILDGNGNILVLTTPGATGSVAAATGPTAPLAARNAAEGTLVGDGGCVWTVAGPMSQGFRVWPLPGATAPSYQVQARYQMIASRFVNMQSLLNPVPDNYSQYFRRGFKAHCLGASPDPKLSAQFAQARAMWLQELVAAAKQGDREQDFYGLVPASYPMDAVYGGGLRNPRDPSQPY
jgi:hypothetical protein